MAEPKNVYQLSERIVERYPDDADVRRLADQVQQMAGVLTNVRNVKTRLGQIAAVLDFSIEQLVDFENEELD